MYIKKLIAKVLVEITDIHLFIVFNSIVLYTLKKII